MRPFSDSLPMALLRGRETTMQLFRPMLAAHDLTEQQWRVLRALTDPDAPIEVTELAARTFLLGPSLSRILSNLGERGLVERRPHPADQRRALIALSASGGDLVARIAPESESRYNLIEAEFGGDRLRALLAELRALAELGERFDPH